MDTQNSTKASGGDSGDNKEKGPPPFLGPTEIEKFVDHGVIEYARQQGIKDEAMLRGLMSREACNILSQAKLKHRTCKCFY